MPGCTPAKCRCPHHARQLTVRSVDQKAWLVLKRIAAVAAMLPQQSKAPPIEAPPPPAPLDAAIARLGHVAVPGRCSWTHVQHSDEGYEGHSVPVSREQAKQLYHCQVCGASWTRRTKRALINAGPCPGDNIWAHSLPPSLDAPWIYPRASRQPVCWLGATIHLSHALQYYRGCVYCNVCGARSARQVAQALCAPCLLRPTSDRVARRLKSMRRGVWPDAGSDWPMPHHHQAPYGFILLRPARAG